MRDKTKYYMEWAMQVINNSDNQIFGTGIRHPWQEYGFDINSNISIFELEGDHRDKSPIQFGDAKDMLMYWENTPKDGTAEKTNRRVILVQDMHPRVVKLLGVLLDIPPRFFLAHCDGFVDLSIIDGAFAKKNRSTYWKVAVPRWRVTPNTIPPGQYYIEAGNFTRQELHKKPQTTYITLKSLVSYWGKSYEPDSWTAVVLMDPFKTYVRPKFPESSDGPACYELPEIKFTREFVQEVLNTGIRSDGPQSSRRSTFDAAVATYGEELDSLPHTKDPFTGTAYIRNIIRSTWESFVVRRSREVHDLIFDDQMEHATISRG
ncbi:uncharacterized protein F4812DRAFT_469456 [Daldinia caldariorum]|uniref:uncharacterized protein n=1 Tax=Daldinia caldariorum TaxID=326644 RepID=UPI0020087496|nr:uncharacterized protein F4812DRAFT_469456 [Daldinia caldariorum]KAI1463157.1 hypothetical protein F4812DRAFT_469456 [Daldinia caldariorum]